MAGGHLGSAEELPISIWEAYDGERYGGIMDVTSEYADKYGCKIPVAVAGGIDGKAAVDHYLSLWRGRRPGGNPFCDNERM